MAPRRFFTDEDKALLSVLVKANPILTSHKPDPTTSFQKKKKWKEVADIYNSNCKGQKRNIEQLRKCWKNMKFKEKQYRTSVLNHPNDVQGGSSRRQGLDIASDSYDPIQLGSDDEPEYILPSVCDDDDSDMLENSVQEDIFKETGCTIEEGLEHAVIVEDGANIPVPNNASTRFVRILPAGTSQSDETANDHDLHMIDVHQSRPGSADSSTNDIAQKAHNIPKKTVTKPNRRPSNMDSKLLEYKIANEKAIRSETIKKMEFLDEKLRLLHAEEARKKDKHKREMMLIESQIKYWQDKKKHLNDDSFYMS